MRKLVILTALAMSLLAGCASYTVREGLEVISVPEEGTAVPTRLAQINEEKDRLAAMEAREREAQNQEEAERQALLEARESFNSRIESARVLNDYPEDLTLLDCPHVYRPADSSTYLDENFTDFTLVFVPLGQEELDSASAQTIASALRPSDFDFIVTTGSRENQVMLARALGMDTVTLEGGSVSFSTVLKDADSTSASFSLTEDKDLTIIPADQSRKLTLSPDLDIASWVQALTAESEADISSLESLTAGISDSEVILALSAGQPASSDWTPFTPYSYRTEYSWPVSDYLDRTFSDSYAATRYSGETDSGVTLVTDVLHERMDRLYTRGLIEAGTSVLSLPVLSDAEPQRFAVTAVYIHP